MITDMEHNYVIKMFY